MFQAVEPLGTSTDPATSMPSSFAGAYPPYCGSGLTATFLFNTLA
jgi:hypothetical protein